MKATKIKSVGEVKIEVCVEFDKFNDEVAELLSFLDFPLRVDTSIASASEEDFVIIKRDS